MNRRSFLKLLGGAVALLKFDPGALVKAVKQPAGETESQGLERYSSFRSDGDSAIIESSEGWQAIWVKDKTLSAGMYKYGATVRWVIPPAKPWCAQLVRDTEIPECVVVRPPDTRVATLYCLSTNPDLRLRVIVF